MMQAAVRAQRSTTFTSMASSVTLRVVDPTAEAEAALVAAQQRFEDVAAACTRFDPTSPLMRANAAPTDWHKVPAACIQAVQAAHAAYIRTEGRFDPRVLADLVALGYGESRQFDDRPLLGTTSAPQRSIERPKWEPRFDGQRMHLGGIPIDLGGIGKGLAVRWAAELLQSCGAGALVEAGGDLLARGLSPDGDAWLVGVENPWNTIGDPVAVLDATDAAVATSSIRLRSWTQGGAVRHHLIDPRTGLPGGAGLVAVTVIGSDPADAEVMSKTLFLAGAAGIARAAQEARAAAIWIDVDGTVAMTPAAAVRCVWQVAHAQH